MTMNKKTMVLPALLILSLFMAGLAYGLWSDTLLLSGTVATGEVEWEYSSTSCLDTTGFDFHCRDGFVGTPDFWMGVKDVGSTTVAITDSHTVTVILTNVYPCYFTSVSVYAVNTGTIPLIIDSVDINGVTLLRDYPTPVVGLDLGGDSRDDVEIWWGNGFGVQLHTGDRSPEMSFWIHVLQDAPQGAALTFTISLTAVQYNEYVPP